MLTRAGKDHYACFSIVAELQGDGFDFFQQVVVQGIGFGRAIERDEGYVPLRIGHPFDAKMCVAHRLARSAQQ